MRRAHALPTARSGTRDPQRMAVSVLVVGGFLLLTVIWWQAVPQLRPDPWITPQSYLNAVTIVILLVAAWFAARTTTQRANAPLLLAAGWGVAFGELGWILAPRMVVAEWVLQPVAPLMLAWLLLRWPRSRLDDLLERRFIVFSMVSIPTLQVVETLLWDPIRHGVSDVFWPTLVRADRLHDVVFFVESVLIVVLLLGLVWLVVRRCLRASRLSRRSTYPSVVAASLMAVGFGGLSLTDITEDPSNWWRFIGCAGELTVPLAFLSATLLERLQRALALEGVLGSEQLSAEELRARLDEVQGSRARLVEAALAERRRMERDLHDGAQQRLLGAAAILGRARHDLGRDHPAAPHVEEARQELRGALAELRELVHGVHPPALTRGGLRTALEELAGRAPMPVRYAVPDTRAPADQELCAWFVIREGIANAAKHAEGSLVSVEVRDQNGSLVVTVDDTGLGGIVVTPGGGLEGLRDRVDALGGSLHVGPAPSGGSRLRAWLPCG